MVKRIMLGCKKYILVAVAAMALSSPALDRPDYYTAGFYTRGADEASYRDQGGVIDPIWLPVKKLAVIPRVTLEASGDDNYFMDHEDGAQESTQIRLIPGALLILGRPEHNHLYLDVGVNIPLSQSHSSVDDNPSFFGKAGGVYKTGKSQVSGAVGYRREEQANRMVGERVLSQNVNLSGAVEHRLSFKTSLGVIGQTSLNIYDRDEYADSRRYYGAGRLYYRMTAKSEVFLQAGAGCDEIDDHEFRDSNGASFQDLSIGMRGKPTPKTSVNGSVGYRLRQHDDSFMEDVNTWIANLGASVNPFGLSRFSAELQADGQPDINGDSGTVMDRRLSLGVDRRLFTERLHGNASLQFGTLDYYGAGDRLNDEYWGYTIGLDWWTRHNISFGGAYSYVERDGEGRSAYHSGRWSLRMSWNY